MIILIFIYRLLFFILDFIFEVMLFIHFQIRKLTHGDDF